MAFITESNSAIYLGVSEGKFVRRHKTANERTTERINKNGKVVYEEFIKGVTGYIVGIKTKENEYGKFWVVEMKDGDENYIIEFNYSGGVATAFLKTLPNVDFDQPVSLIPNMKIDGDKKKTGMFISQNGNSLKWFWNKDNPGDLPPLEKKKVKGKEVWDDSEQAEYLEKYINDNILPKIYGRPNEDDNIPEADF